VSSLISSCKGLGIQPLSRLASNRSIISLTLCRGSVFSLELSSTIIRGVEEASTVMLLRDGLFGRQGLLVLAWLLDRLKVFLSLSISVLAFEAKEAAGRL
jgi:hypothetical protein